MSAVDGLKTRLLALSAPDGDGVYRDGADKRHARTVLAVDCLRGLWDEACGATSFVVPDRGVGLAATGSLSRGQIGPCSDLDLVLIHDGHTLDSRQIAELADLLWYPLWDSGLDLDHAVRSRTQCEAVTDHDLPAAVGWLEVRPIAGDTELIEDTASSILERWRKAARRRLPELLDSAQARLAESGRMSYLNQPNIKEAHGGLRDTVLVSALAASWLADRPHGRYDDAVERLLDVRDCIHLASGRDTNLLLTAYQPRVAAMLGLADPTLPEDERAAASIDDLMTMIARLGRTVSFAYLDTASRARRSLVHDRTRFAFFQMLQPRAAGRREAPKFDAVAPGVVRHEGEIALAPGVDPSADATLPLRVAVASGESGLPINPVTLTNLTRCPLGDSGWDGESRALLIRLLSCGAALPEVWERLDYVGIPGRWMPEWLGVRNRPSVSAAHRYTIDQHMIQVVARLGRGGGRPDGRGGLRGVGTGSGITAPIGMVPSDVSAPGLSEQYDDEHYTALLLAGLLHDIGKRPGVRDHAAEGARHVPVILRRMGFDGHVVGMAALLVREHLTLSEFATGQDPNDPATGAELAERVGCDPVMLDMLFDLTRADGSSLGATSDETITKRYGWSPWRESTARIMLAAARRFLM
ncbi:protein-PII uridylyltransferase [uncultured Bifidobacterium sp.]|uniref:[protein-PII] uridylyltransferase family protein n=1 Tax=uncultured Bifidobacterium sp. TaxID=165187 RepID=UPI002591EB11|nr:protein-PII uridylyltransferase [uncultured Bifidobacterium sp.]